MALTDENGSGSNMVMPVAPMFGGGGNSGNGGFGDWGSGFWIILLFILLGGWGNGFGNNNNGGGGMWGADGLYPWMNNSQNINGGFRDQMFNSQIAGIQNSVTSGFGDVQNALCSGFGGVQNSLCAGFAGVNAGIAGAQNALAQQMYVNQISDLERSFAAQTANTSGLTALQSQLASCCCENRMATADTKFAVSTEACATRTADAQNTRDIIDSQTRGTQAILDKLCALELDGVKGQLAAAQRDNIALQNQLNMANLSASQTSQTAQIREGQIASVSALVNELRSCPIPSQPVYGSQPIFSCPQNMNMGCGCGA